MKKRPEEDLSDEELEREIQKVIPGAFDYPLIEELFRRYNKKKEELKTYCDHIGNCPRRPCKCGFKDAWDNAT